uniref:Peptidase S33 tripeptidyl aminopeptidase-like C-terminal domain-containing protein n=1 Tax=Phytophthora ramorum TaxID=164328 RepID=H3GVR2_PHYRM
MDHRGTGRSTRLDCVAAQAGTTGSPLGSDMDPSEVSACAQDLEFKYGDLSSFSMTSAATDVATFVSEYTNAENTIIYGVSYGTALVERLMHFAPPAVTGYVLDGIATTSGVAADKYLYMSKWDVDFGEVGDAFLELCEDDQDCSAHFQAKDLSSTLENLIKKIDKDPNSTCASLISNAKSVNPVQVNEPPSFPLRRTLGSLLADLSLRTLIPPVIYRLSRCASKDIDVLTQFVTAFNALIETKYQDYAYRSLVLYGLIVFTEMWETPVPSIQDMKSRFTKVRISDGSTFQLAPLYCAFTKEKSPACDKFNVGGYKASGIIYERDEYWNKSATIPKHASVLLLSGKLDPQTPNKYAEYLLDVLVGDNKELVTFDYATHGAMVSTPPVDGNLYGGDTCGMKIIASYVRNGGNLARLDKSCVDEMPAFDMTIPTEYQYSYLRTEDAYDGVYDRSEDTSEASG